MVQETYELFGDRMKSLEKAETSRRFDPSKPLYARLDGRGFSKFTRTMLKPYDPRMTLAMQNLTMDLVKEFHATIGYTQSDEISLVWPECKEEGSRLFNNKVFKMLSVVPTYATASFGLRLMETFGADALPLLQKRPHLDARFVPMPTRKDLCDMLLWRYRDAQRNSVFMVAQHHFSHKSLQGQNCPQMIERLKVDAGVDFYDYAPEFRNGTFFRKETVLRSLTDEELARIPERHRPSTSDQFERTEIKALSMPDFRHITNPEETVFEGAEPIFYRT